MSATSLVQAASSDGEGFTGPGPIDFDFPPIPGLDFGSVTIAGYELSLGVTKPMLLLVLGGVLAFVLLRVAAGKGQMVPGRVQYLGEISYTFVRNTMGRDIIGSEKFMKYVPFLVTLFFFILINNLFAAIPFLQFPPMSRSAFPYTLAAIVWLVYVGAGISEHGLVKYLKLQTMPTGVPPALLILLIPLEFLSNILVRPVTLALRLFANLFAGHLLVVLFAVGGQYMLLEGSLALKPVSLVAWAMYIAIAFLELLVQFLQAFIFTVLAALYIQSSITEDH